MKIKLGKSNKSRLEDLIYEIEMELTAFNWKDDEIRKYIKRIVKEYFNK